MSSERERQALSGKLIGGKSPGAEQRDDQRRWQEAIAIVGMSARFPKCATVDEYWRHLRAGDDLLTAPTEGELSAAQINPENREQQHFVASGTRLEGAEDFDAKFFDLSRREAEIMDPQQRIFLECAYEALEHAGFTGDGESVGVFAGTGLNTYMLQLLGNPEILASAGGYQLMLGNDKDFLATRVAYRLNLRGPAVAVQTACSTSLAAVHLACQSLLAGECDSALAGGVSIMFPQLAGYSYIPGMILSPDGVCRPFDERARGTVPGKGAGVVVLKRESDALAAGDTIYAVIGGSAWNNDGSAKAGYTAPSVDGQARVIRDAQAASGIAADQVSFVEAHGTGTELGDPIEVAALAQAFGKRPANMPRCLLGSAKANMGHADVAAGIAGLIKAALALHHGVIPPTPHFEKANPALELERTPFRVSATEEGWPTGELVHWAGVSSFGIGGTNVHVCLRTAVQSGGSYHTSVNQAESPRIFPLSAKSDAALENSVRRLCDFVEVNAELPLASAALTLQAGRRTYRKRRAAVASSRSELLAALRKTPSAAGVEAISTAGNRAASGSVSPIVFLFPGQGQQFPGMASSLYCRDGHFRGWIERGLAILPQELASTILDFLCGTDSESHESGNGILATSIAQPLLFLVEYVLAMRWIDAGVQPWALIGHSLGELTAAAVAGVFSFEDGLRLAVKRGQLMQDTAPGAMLAVGLNTQDLAPYLSPQLWIAAENGPKLTVISGSVDVIEKASKNLSLARVATVRLPNDRAFHTPEMAEAAASFAQAVAAVERHRPSMRWLSNVSGTWISAEEAMSAQYWADQMTSRVRFSENAAAVVIFNPFLLEIGPGDALSTLIRQQPGNPAKSRKAKYASTLGRANRRGDDFRCFLDAAAQLWEEGLDLDWKALPGADDSARRIALPTYPFERERHFVETTRSASVTSSNQVTGCNKAGTLLKRSDPAEWFYVPAWQPTPRAELMLRPSTPIATWIVLVDQAEFREALIQGLEVSGAKVVALGSENVNRGELDDFWKSYNPLFGSQQVGLINCWNLGTTTGHAKPDDQGYKDFLLLLQSSQRARVRFSQIEVLCDELFDVNGESAEQPSRSLVEGLTRILPAEFAETPVRLTDLGKLNTSSIASATALFVSELRTAASLGAATVVAYRAAKRWQQFWQSIRLEAARHSRIRHEGCYVITGGLGGVGYLLAGHLLRTYRAKVALIGRTILPSRARWEEWLTEHGPAEATSQRIQRAKDLEQLGGKLLLINADVADESSMQRAWQSIESAFGSVHGVIHAAGLPGGARVAAQQMDAVRQTLRPKVDGSKVLAKLLAGKPLDFLLFCSSISAVVPIAGAADYAAANAFQDRYAVWCKQHLGLPAISVNFDAWQEFGMAAEMKISAEFQHVKQARLETAMSSPEATEVFERALACGETQVLVSTVDFQNVMQVAATAPMTGEAVKGADKATPADSNSSGAEQADLEPSITPEIGVVLSIWRDLLGVESVDPDDNFFELGGHSLLGTMVLARIRERYGVELTIRAIFESPTPVSLAKRIRAAESQAEPVGVARDREEFEF